MLLIGRIAGSYELDAVLAALPEVPELVVAATPMEAAEGVLEDCAAVTFSCDIGVAKPHPEAYRVAVDALAAQPTRPETQYYLGMVNHRLRNNEHALQWMREAQKGFAKTEDKRDRVCERWIREFEKLVDEGLLRINPANPDAPQLDD